MNGVASLVTPDTLLRWYRNLIAKKYDGSHRWGPGRPTTHRAIAQLVCTMAADNPGWGYTRLRGALFNIGHDVGRNTIKRILADAGLEPAPERSRKTTWKTFLKAHWGAVAATDFLTVEILTMIGLVRYFILFVIDLRSRRVQIVGTAHQLSSGWMAQMARNLTDAGDGFLHRVIPLGPRHLRRILREFLEHYNRERNHQGLGNNLLVPATMRDQGPVPRRERLGGTLNFYFRDAA